MKSVGGVETTLLHELTCPLNMTCSCRAWGWTGSRSRSSRSCSCSCRSRVRSWRGSRATYDSIQRALTTIILRHIDLSCFVLAKGRDGEPAGEELLGLPRTVAAGSLPRYVPSIGQRRSRCLRAADRVVRGSDSRRSRSSPGSGCTRGREGSSRRSKTHCSFPEADPRSSAFPPARPSRSFLRRRSLPAES